MSQGIYVESLRSFANDTWYRRSCASQPMVTWGGVRRIKAGGRPFGYQCVENRLVREG